MPAMKRKREGGSSSKSVKKRKFAAQVKKVIKAAITKPRRKVKGQVTSLKKRVAKLEKSTVEGEITHIDKVAAGSYTTIIQGQQSILTTGRFNKAVILAILGRLQVWDRATSEFVAANFTFGTTYKKIFLDKVVIKYELTNNNQLPVRYHYYMCAPKHSSDTDAGTDFATGVEDMVTDKANMTYTMRMVKPPDVPTFTAIWSIKNKKTGIIQPGQTVTIYHTIKDIMWCDEVEYKLYDRRLKTVMPIFLFEGTPGHRQEGGAITGVGYTDGNVLFTEEVTATVRYDGGLQATRLAMNDLNDKNRPTGDYYKSVRPVNDLVRFSLI